MLGIPHEQSKPHGVRKAVQKAASHPGSDYVSSTG